MPRQRLLLAGSWIVTTAVATAVSAAGVSIVTRDVTDEHRPTIRQADVIALLAAPASTVPTTTSPPPTEPPTSTTVADPPGVTVPPPPPPPATQPPATEPPPPAPTDPPFGDAWFATFESTGGTAVVGCLGDAIALGSAWPNDGYRLVVVDAGPERVEVAFTGRRGEDRIEAECARGRPVRTDGKGSGRSGDGKDRGSEWGGDGWNGEVRIDGELSATGP